MRLALLRECRGDLQQQGTARGVVIGAGVDALFLPGTREGIRLYPTPQMVVVGAGENPFARGPGPRRNGRHHVAVGALAMDDSRFEANLGSRQHEASRGVRVFLVQFGLCLLERFARGRQQCVSHLHTHRVRKNPGSAQRVVGGQPHQFARLWGGRPGHHKNGLRPALPRQHRLVPQARIAVELGAPRRLHALGHVTQKQHHLVLDLQPVVRVVAQRLVALRHGQPVTAKDHLGLGRARVAEGQRPEILLQRKGRSLSCALHRQRVVAFQ